MVVARRGLDRKTRPSGDATALAFVGIAIDHEAKTQTVSSDCPALRAVELRSHRARFDVYVVSCVGIADRDLIIPDVMPIPNRLGTTLFSSWMDPT